MRSNVLLFVCLLPVSALSYAEGDAGDSGGSYASGDPPETVLITSTREKRTSKGATGLTLDIRDTPQSISVVTAEQMNEFGANSVNDALRLVPGIQVEEWETNRTNFIARGFEIKNTQVDGVGLPNDWGIVTGAMDSFGYEKIEVIRGANGLLTGVGNASGTINYVRKRPTNDTRGSVELSGGSWGYKRIEADYSTPFTSSGRWAGRLVVASEDKGSYIRGVSNNRTFVYGVVDGELSEHSTFTAGYSYQVAHTKGNMWGALVFAYSDGTQADFNVSASTSQDWTYWHTFNQTAFAEYAYALPHDWTLKLSYNFRSFHDDNQLFFAYSVTGIDRATGLGLFGWPGKWPTEDIAHLVDLSLSGDFELLGREHEALFGLDHSQGRRTQYWDPVDTSDPAFGAMPPFPYPGNAVPEPAWGPRTFYGVTYQKLDRAYGATHLALTDSLAAVLGFNWTRYHRDGEQTGVGFDQTERKFSPYAGLTYALLDNLQAYGSYSDIYQPQDYTDINGKYLNPTKGVNYEVGLKADWMEKRLLTTLAWFKARQSNLGTYAGMDSNGNYYYVGAEVASKGVEAEVTGRLTKDVSVVLGYTTMQLKDQNDLDTYEWVPRRTATLSVTSKLPGYSPLTLGLSGRWQSQTSTVDSYTGVRIRQGSYGVLNTFIRWDVTRQLSLRANVDNLTDRKYISSLYQIGFYGAPRHYELSLNYQL